MASRARRVVWPPGTWTLATKDDAVYEAYKPVDELMSDAERRRLLYVATTRAQDHLVVSLHRSAAHHQRQKTSAALLATCSADAEQRVHQLGTARLAATTPAPAQLPWADEEEWAEVRDAAVQRAAVPSVLSATALAKQFTEPDATEPDATGAAGDAGDADDADDDPGIDPALRKDAVDLDLPPWQRGRYGTAIGRAVHAVLQHADLVDGTDLATLSVTQAAAEGVLGMEDTIERLAASALRTPIVRAGVQHEHWRELFVATAFGGHVVEGYIDLLVRHPERGLVVVDYKTDQLTGAGDRTARLARYGVQLAAYGLALESILGEPVDGGVLVLCSVSGPAEEIEVAGWADLQRELRERLTAGP